MPQAQLVDVGVVLHDVALIKLDVVLVEPVHGLLAGGTFGIVDKQHGVPSVEVGLFLPCYHSMAREQLQWSQSKKLLRFDFPDERRGVWNSESQ